VGGAAPALGSIQTFNYIDQCGEARLEYRILGPLEVRRDGRPVRIGGPQQRALLGALLLNAGRVVSVDRLTELLWPHDPPETSRELLRGCVARLRRVLRADDPTPDDGPPLTRAPGDGPLLTRAPGYLLRVGPGELDADRFARLVAAAGERAGTEAAALLREAVALWRGPALADLTLPGIRAVAEGLDEQLAAALEERVDLDLAAGRHAELAGELTGLVRTYPLRERMWAQLMLARYAAGRPAEALGAYRDLRRNLVDQLGVEPSEPLRRLERAILAGEDVAAAYRAGPAPRRPEPPEPPRRSTMVGRSGELAAVRGALAGGARLLGVAGDPGIGKSRLLAELADDARGAGRTVLAGHAAEYEQEVPFGVFRNALDDRLRTLEPARLAGLSADERRLLPTVFPVLPVAPGGPGTPLPAAERYLLHRAVRALLECLAQPAGLVLVLDDLHWCDEGSAELLGHLVRNPPVAPVLLAVAYRPRQLSARLHQEVVAAARREVAVLVDVAPLSFEEAVALLPGGLTGERRRELYQASAGNPFYLELLGRGGPAAPLAAGTDGSAPEWVRAALAGEFAVLSATGRRVAHAAAVAGDAFDAHLVAAIAELPGAVVLDALDELSTRDLIRPATAGFEFRHPLLRSAAYQHAKPGWRIGAHARGAAELARRGAPAAEQARHIELSAAPGDLDAVDLLRASAADALHATPAAAAHWLGSALRLLPHRPAVAGRRLELLHLRAQALGITGHLAESRDILIEVLRMLPVGTVHRVTVLSFLTMLEHLLGNHGQARALLTGELAALPDQHGTAAGALRVAVALTAVMHGDVRLDEVRAAIDVARGTGERPLLAAALTVGAVACHSFDVTNAGVASWVDEAAGLVDAMSSAELAGRLDAALFLGWAETYLERFGRATDHLDRALAVARGTGQSNLIGPLRLIAGVAHLSTGDLARAEQAFDAAMESAVLTGGQETRGRILIYRTWVTVWAGDLDAALALGAEAVALAGGRPGADWQSGPAEANLGFARYAAGRPDECVELLLRAGGGPDLPTVREVWRPRWFEHLSAAATAAGRHREAAGYADRAGRLPVVAGLHRRTGLIRLAQVHPLLATDPAGAARLARQAAELFERSGDRLGAAQAHLLAGVGHRDHGAAREADDEIASARRAFTECGARPLWLARRLGVAL
jgi:DNA-binding SARP family transcriptional activator/tetratricopeptide (TPR) repeat protein